MYQELLAPLGLSKHEISIYELLLAKGQLTARQISHESALSRTNSYHILNKLKTEQLIEEVKLGKKTAFRVTHPQKLHEFVEKQKQALSAAENALQVGLPELVSKYNLAVGKPGVQFYEGEEAVKVITEDTMRAKSVIYQYVDFETVQKYVAKENEEYKKRRTQAGTAKRLLVPDTVFNRQAVMQLKKDTPGEAYQQLTQVRFIKAKPESFQATVYLYDNKSAYLTLQPDRMIGFVFEDPILTIMQRAVFDCLWEQSGL